MRREEIIAKGAYTAPQFEELVSVKQFIILRQRGAKHLLLRLHNDRAERVDTLSFKVKQYDVKGNLIGTETVTKRSLAVEGGEDFTLEDPVKLNRACIDFTVEMIYAEYGDYTYRLHGGVLSASYENRSDTPPIDKAHVSKQMGGKPNRVSVQTLNAPKLLVASMAAILLIVGIFAAIQLKNFMATEEFFTLDKVDFRFVTDNHVDGPISIVGYNGKAGNIIIPTSIEGHPVASIGDGAFEGRMLKSVTIKGSPSIGQKAFAWCRLMDTVHMPDVTALGAGAFSDCRSLKNVTLSSELTDIPASAFARCMSLSAITLPDSLVSLGDGAFAECNKLTEIILPDTLANMGEGVFADCESVVSLTAPYAGINQAGRSSIGFFFGGSNRIPKTLRSIVITRATSIGDDAFCGCEGLVSVQLPDTVTHIGTNAFGGCFKLTDLTLPTDLVSIGPGAFRDCISLTAVAIPEGVHVIPQSAFAGCSGLQSISLPTGLETIGFSAFKDCAKITQLNVPSSVTTIKADALNGCTGLETLTVPFMGESEDDAAPLSHLFGDTTHALKTLTVQNVGEIPDYAFAEFDNLTTVYLYGNAESIGERAFENCASLQSLLLPESVTEIHAYAFAGCSSLTSMQLPAELTVISEGLFANCEALQTVDVPSTIQAVEAYAFSNCAALTDASWLSTVENLGECAFESCTALETVLLYPQLEKIENGTFSGCESLRTLSLPSTITIIGEQAFYGCSSLESLSLPQSTAEIMKEAFADCSGLTALALPSSVNKLGESAFAGCSSISELNVPASVTEIGQNLVNRCTGLETLIVPFIGLNLETADRLTYLSESIPARLQYVRITNAKSLADNTFSDCSFVETILLPDGLLSVGDEAFLNCAELESLIIPETVTEIGTSAFSGCSSLKEISIPNSVTRLKANIFEGCNSLEKITVPFIGRNRSDSRSLSYLFTEHTWDNTIPSTLTEVTLTNAVSLAASTFENCSQITAITLNCDLETVGNRAFANCTSLQELILPDTVENIGDYAFEGCSSARKILIPSSATYIGYHALSECYALEELEIPFVGTSREDGTVFADMFGYSWSGNVPRSLTKVTVTNSNYVKDNAFAYCSGISEIVYDCDVTTIGNYAFDGCTALTQFSIPDTVVSIGEYAFRSCSALQELSLPTALDRIGMSAFEGCSGIRSLAIPATVSYIGYNSLNNCYSLEELEIPFVGLSRDDGSSLSALFDYYWYGGVPSNLKRVTVTDSTTVTSSAFFDCASIEEITYSRNVTAIGDYAFNGCSSLTTLSVSDTVESIGNSAFRYCRSLSELSLPNTLESIGECAFEGCSSIQTLVIPTSVTYIGPNALYNCSSLEELEIPFVGTSRNDSRGFFILFNYYWSGDIPESLTRVTVTDSTTVKDNAFSDCTGIEEILFDCDVTSIGSYAFSGCHSLAQFTIPDTVESIGNSAFYACHALEEISIPSSVESIGTYAFQDCDKMTEVTLSDGLVSIGHGAFYNCSALTSVIIPDTVTSIGQYTFAYCYALQELSIPFIGESANNENRLTYLFDSAPESLKKLTVTNSTEIPSRAFQYSGFLETIIYTQDVISIGDRAFQYCYALKTLDVGESFESIGSYAFSGCQALKSFTVPETCQTVGRYAFSETYALYEVYNLSDLVFSQEDSTGLRNNRLVYRDDNTEVIRVSENGFEFLLADNGEWYLIDYSGDSDTLSLPAAVSTEESEINNYRIALYALYGRKDLRSVTIPAAVVDIGDSAFGDCPNLREVYNLSPLTVTRGSDNNGCVALNAYIVHVSTEAEPLTQVEIGDFDFVKSDDNWFLIDYSGNSTEIVLDSFTYEGSEITYEVTRSAFEYNCNITSLVITDAVTRIDVYAFQSMDSLRRVTIHENATLDHIPEYAFAWCYNLRQITLPSTLTEIEYNAFWECTYLREIYNFSPLSLTMGSDDHGCVAAYALIIHDSPNDPPLTEVVIGDYQFLNSGDVWLLEQYNGTEATVVLGTFTHNSATIDAYSVMPGAFQNNSHIEHLQIGDQVKSIGRNAFQSCNNLKTVSFEHNTSITKIQPDTFANNGNLDRIVLPASLTEIGTNAFWDCVNLLEVYNPSSMQLTPGDFQNGYVTRYARVVHTALNADGLRIVNVDHNGYTFKFIQEDGVWSMYARVQRDTYDRRFNLPELVVNGDVTPYNVTANISGYRTIVLPASVSYVNWDNFTGNEICYTGTAQQFETLTAGFNMNGYTVRYYTDCVHGNGQWTYGDNGDIITYFDGYTTVAREGTCLEKGVTRYTCYICQESWEQEDETVANHSLTNRDEGFECLVCGKRFEEKALQDVWNVTNDLDCPFDITESGEIVSTNKDHRSSATITLEAREDTVFMYRYYTSTESGCDTLTVCKNGDEITFASGQMTQPILAFEVEISAGDVITVTYSKDGSVSSGEDLVKILNLVYFVEEAGDNNA